jgi:hypothetical protein
MANLVIEYSDHAEKRVNLRNIKKSQVIKTIKFPDNKVGSFKGRIVVNKKFFKQTLEIVYVEENSKIIIITLYYL